MENCGIHYYPPTSSMASASLKTDNKKRQRARKTDDGNKKDGNAGKKMNRLTGEESYSGNANDGGKNFNADESQNLNLFRQLVDDLDICLDKAIIDWYGAILDDISKLLNAPSTVSDLVPALIVRGQCIDWNSFYKLIKRNYSHVVISEPEDTECANEMLDNLKEGQKLLLFLRANLYTDNALTQIFSHIEHRGSTCLVFYTPTTFNFVYERMSRQITTRMSINKSIFPPCEKFIRFLFDEEIPLGLLRRSGILLHGKTLAIAQQHFNYESRSLTNLRKILILALHDFAAISGKKIPEKDAKDKFCQKISIYSAILGAFAKFSGEDKFTVHYNIQSDATYFSLLYGKMKEQWIRMTREEWKTKFKELLEPLQNPWIPQVYLVNCQRLLECLEQRQKEDEEENSPPKKDGPATSSFSSPFGIRRPISVRKPQSTALFIAQQERKRSKMTNPLSEGLRNELISFMDTLFPKYLRPPPSSKFIAGPGNTAILSLSLSAEIDTQLSNLAKEASDAFEGEQLDICLAYYLLVTHDTDFTSIPLDSLANSFHQMTKPIEGMESEARFMTAISQLEHIGALKMVSEGVVRLIYLPAAALSKDLFQMA